MTDGSPGVREKATEMEALRGRGQYTAARRIGEEFKTQLSAKRDHELIDVALALATYKDPEYPISKGLRAALALLTPYLATTQDSETLGIAGAIEKRLYEVDLDTDHLEQALQYYARGHECDREAGYSNLGYPGINAAYLLEWLASLRPRERVALKKRAWDLWTEIVTIPAPVDDAQSTEEALKGKRYFHGVTVADALLGLGRHEEALKRYAEARSLGVEGWKLETTARQLAATLRLRSEAGQIDASGRAALAALVGKDADAIASAIRGKLGLALSGGGFRASLFHIGVLAWLAEIDLLRHVEAISCVSGGSLLGALYYLELQHAYAPASEPSRDDFVAIVKRLVERFPTAVRENLRTRLLFDAGDNAAMLRRESSRTLKLAELYEQYLYAKVGAGNVRTKPRYMHELVMHPGGDQNFKPRYDNWKRRARVPVIVLNAASLNTGHSFQFTPSYMGEPQRMDDDVDVNDRFERHEYEEFPQPWNAVRLGQAAAASACVPVLFEPLELDGAYDHVVRLVDGGVYDNQGANALLEHECTSLIVSDASGQMSVDTDPQKTELGVGLRSNGVLQARLREVQYQDLRSRERGKLLRAVSFLHLKQGVRPRSLAPRAAAGAEQRLADDLGYGVSQAVQERLADLRTDLDAFSELEAEMLMMSGYLMAKKFVTPQKFEGAALPSTPAAYSFERVAPLMKAQPDGSATERRVLELLGVGSSLVGKAFQVDKALRWFGFGVLALLLLGLSFAAWKFWTSDLVRISVGTAVGAFALAALSWRVPGIGPWLDAISPRPALLRVVRNYALAVVTMLLARLSVRFADPVFLRAGKVEPLLKAQQVTSALPAPQVAAQSEIGSIRM